jgi:hypothetical protein
MSNTINISRKEVEGKCDLKCAYNFNYTSSSGRATNSVDSIRIDSIEKTNEPPVLYNKQKYSVFDVNIMYPSLLLYNDRLADAEIILYHTPEQGGKHLLVFIPIKISSDSTSATAEITNIIKSVSVSAPSQGQTVTISNFNLQNIVPKKPFFNFVYTSSYDFIAFSSLDAIPISSSTLDTLKQIVKPKTTQLQKEDASRNGGGDLFYNSSGPNSTSASLGDGIYISCNPTGNSIETKEVTYETNLPVYDLNNILEDPNFIIVMQIVFACLVFMVICFIWNFGYNFIDGEFSSGQVTSVKG